MTYEELWLPLCSIYAEGEAKAVARMLLDIGFGLSLTDIVAGRTETVDSAALLRMQQRLLKGEPVQYVLGVAEFGGRRLSVSPAVLIPRPETFELCQWIIDEARATAVGSILDIGTGSGCIAITLAAACPEAHVVGWDLQQEALAVAAKNAESADVHVSLVCQDALCPPDDHSLWDVVVSNPPYVCRREAAAMERNVLAYEPHTALFVPDDDPLLFYRSIARYASQALKSGGRLYLEQNPAYADQIVDLLAEMGFQGIDVRDDQFGKRRMTKAIRT